MRTGRSWHRVACLHGVADRSLRDTVRYGGGESRWYAIDRAVPSASERAARWDEILHRHPSQPFLWLAAARSAGLGGDPVRAESFRSEAERRWPSMAEFAASH